ncbi:FecR family protein [Mangrovibacterium lignilyticum]|uniref:FecR family protein n=1 Tax=Mangrovibacterium lignilyticum TaxID=2668052 RepID=UPI0013D5EF46|nr:FecR family protein [Mangrovibacterium lignilyticum]
MKWIFQPDELTEKYWAEFIQKNQDEKRLILSIKEELSKLKLKNKELSATEKKHLLQNILAAKEKPVPVKQLRKFSSHILRYAAVALFFLMLGNLVMYLIISNDVSQEDIRPLAATDYSFHSNTAQLLLSNGNTIPLKRNSSVVYKGDKIIADDSQFNMIEKEDSNNNQLIVPYGSKSQITLSDNTVVYLNAGSRLIYPSTFKGSSRVVHLIGEAFFDVSKNKHKPFIVKTDQIDIEVLGTRFNVTTYPENEKIETVLVEGSVSVSNDISSQFEKPVLLKPNQILTFNKQTKSVKIDSVDTEFYTLWKDGMLKFEDAELNQIIHKVERLYDVKIILNDPEKGKMKISGKLNLSENSEDVLNYLSVITRMNVEPINEKNYVMK